MSLRLRALPAGFIAPCLPTSAPEPPSGELWLNEIKHDGLRVIARKDGNQVRLYSRGGFDLTWRFALIDDAIASFDLIRHQQHDDAVFLCAFDLIELNGDDLRDEPLNVRKSTLASVLWRAASGLRLNEQLEADGPTVFQHA